jgi:hypothetical protein
MIEASFLNHNLKIDQLVVLPEPPDVFFRDQSMSGTQLTFSADVKNIAIIPVRAELSKDHLAEYLTMIRGQEIFKTGRKLGLVFLVNDHAGDRHNAKLLEENVQTVKFISSLRGELPPGAEANIPQNYRDIAAELINDDSLQVRVDYVHSNQEFPNFGALRLHLINLGHAFKHPSTPDSEAVLHFHDVDAKLRRTHLGSIADAYEENAELLFNASEFDLIPGTHEDVNGAERDISRDILLNLDNYRLYQYGKLARFALLGLTFSSIVTQSARFSFLFKNGRTNPLVAYTLRGTTSFDDYLLSNIATRSLARTPNAVGFNGEVAFLHRARTSDVLASDAPSGPDGEEVYAVVSQRAFIREGFKGKYDLLTDADRFVMDFEEKAAQLDCNAIVKNERPPYGEILRTEILVETEKIERRRTRIHDFILSTVQNSPLAPGVERTAAPYIQYFPDEVAFIKEQATVRSVEDIAAIFISKYDSFFNPDATIHAQIATLRALKKYAFMLGLSYRKQI